MRCADDVWAWPRDIFVGASIEDFVDWAQIVGGIAAVGALLFAAWQLWLSIAFERRRLQPIVIAHEVRTRYIRDGIGDAGWAVDAYLTNEGIGPAFNVRFGIEYDGNRWPFRLKAVDPLAGNLQRVVRPAGRLPEQEATAFAIPLPSLGVWAMAEKEGFDDRRRYWSRYENARGQTWETMNPGDRSAPMTIRRVRWLVLRERREARRLEKLQHRGVEMDRGFVAELVEMRAKAEADEGAQAEDKPGDP